MISIKSDETTLELARKIADATGFRFEDIEMCESGARQGMVTSATFTVSGIGWTIRMDDESLARAPQYDSLMVHNAYGIHFSARKTIERLHAEDPDLYAVAAATADWLVKVGASSGWEQDVFRSYCDLWSMHCDEEHPLDRAHPERM